MPILMKKLQHIANRIWQSPKYQHLLFAAATLVAVLFTGYHFGTFDQVIHIPYLRKFADPALYPNDAFFEMRFQHYSYFWFVWLPFYKLGILEISLFITHLLVTYITFWAIWTLCKTLFHDPLVCLLGTLAFVIPHISFSGFPVLEFSVLNRTVVLPVLLWTLILYLNKRTLWAYFILGLLYNLHVVSVNFAMGMVVFDTILRFRTLGWRTVLSGWLLFLAGAAPVLWWKTTGPPIILKPNPAWLSLTSAQCHHLFYPLTLYPHIVFPTLSGFTAFGLYAIARRHNPSPEHDHILDHFMIAVALILLVQLITSYGYPITILMQLQIIRAGLFASIFGLLYFIQYLVAQFRKNALNTFDSAVLMCATLTLSFPVFLWVVLGLSRLRASRWRKGISLVLWITMGIVPLLLSGQYEVWGPGLHIFGPQNAWQDAQTWARDHTPRDALFITPPYKWEFYDSEWRVFSERSTLVTMSDLLEVALVPDYAPVWEERFEDLAPGAIDQFGGDYFENRAITARAFHTLDDGAVQRIATKYNATYFVVEKQYAYDFPVAYTNEEFVIYQLEP